MQQLELLNLPHRYCLRYNFGDELAIEAILAEWVVRGVMSWFDADVLKHQMWLKLEINQ